MTSQPRASSSSRFVAIRIENAWNRILHTGEDIQLQQSLTMAQAASVTQAVELLNTTQLTFRQKQYQQFLYDLLRVSGPHLVLICAVALGQVRVTRMKKKDREQLILNIESNAQHKGINYSAIHALAKAYHIPPTVNDVLANRSQRTADGTLVDTGIARADSQTNTVLTSVMMNPTPPKEQLGTNPNGRLGFGAQGLGESQYWSFSFMSRRMTQNLPEPFLTGLQTSDLWRQEAAAGGLAVTNCLSLHLPKVRGEDAFCVIRIGYDDGFKVCNLFGFGEPDISV